MRASEALTTLSLCAFCAVALAAGPVLPAAAAYAALAVATALLARAAPAGGPLAAVRDLLPVAVVVTVYSLLEPVIAGVNPARWDAALAAFDDRHLPGLVPAWRGVLGRAAWFTDAVYLGYVSFYLLPISAGLLGRARGPAAFDRAAVPVLLCFYLSFVGYLLFPTLGPRLPHADEARLLGGGAVSGAVRAFLAAAEATRLDAFPSGHTAISLVSAAAAARLAPRAAPALWAWGLLVTFSTVYVHVHYAVDVLAGVALAALTLLLAPAVARALGRGRG